MENEKRLIDAYVFYKKFANDIPIIKVGEQRYVATWRISDLIADAPTVDAVEVVRCGNCVKRKKNVEWGMCHVLCRQTHKDDFCSHGERRTDDCT